MTFQVLKNKVVSLIRRQRLLPERCGYVFIKEIMEIEIAVPAAETFEYFSKCAVFFNVN